MTDIRRTDKANTVIKSPRITEKATDLSAQNIYTFDIDPRANKADVVAAVRELYKVTPAKVRLIPVPSKVTSKLRKPGRTARGKKALVYLKEGDTIEFV